MREAMTRALILTFPEDIHATEVALALGDMGHEAVLWYGADFPSRQTASIRIEGGEVRWEARGEGLDVPLGGPPFDVVWFRRPSPPDLPEEELHPGDRKMARQECETFIEGLWRVVVPPGALEVNPLDGRLRARSKAIQLREAQTAGLRIPPTLMSNDPERIREFLGEQARDGAIYKPFFPAQWESGPEPEDRVALLVTTELTADDLPENDMVRLTPGIFQAKVPKSHELRVTWMGRHAVTAVLRSQASEATRVDWRAGQGDLPMEAGDLPVEVRRGCQELMERLGLVFGCFDFVVTPEGEHVFLEVNPMGQFLWKEEGVPELTLLDDFCAFLIEASPDFAGPREPARVHHGDYTERAREFMERAAERHVRRFPSFLYSDLPDSSGASADREEDALPPDPQSSPSPNRRLP